MTTEDFKSLHQVSPALTNDMLSEALSKWFKKEITFTHWEVIISNYYYFLHFLLLTLSHT